MPPKLTPQEKKALKAAKKAERKRLAEEAARQQLLNHLEREVKYGDLTVQRHEKSWKAMLTKIAVPRMKEEMQHAWHIFERTIDAKDFTISLLMDEIKDAEEQYMLNFSAHLEHINELIEMFRSRVEELKAHKERTIAEICSEGEKEADNLVATFEDGEEYLKTMLYGLEVCRKEQEKRVRAVYLSKIDEETTKYADIIHSLKSVLEYKLALLWDATNKFLEDYRLRTKQRRNEYHVLKLADDSMQHLIQEQRVKIKHNTDLIKKLRQRFAKTKQQRNIIAMDLMYEKNSFSETFYMLKNRLEQDNNIGMKNLEQLTSSSAQAVEALTKILNKGRNILKLYSICRKLESEKEKIRPFPVTAAKLHNILERRSNIDIKSLYFENDDLYLFWQKVAYADALRYCLNEEREFLIRENKRLKVRIHQYCECLDCPSLPPVCSRRNVGKPNVTLINLHVENYFKFNK